MTLVRAGAERLTAWVGTRTFATASPALSTPWDAWRSRAAGVLRSWGRPRRPARPLAAHPISAPRAVPPDLPRPEYARQQGASKMPSIAKLPEIQNQQGLERMRAVGRLAALALQHAGRQVAPGVTTDALDVAAHEWIVAQGAYPSPLNYGGFPKSVCTSVNECVCHGVPSAAPLREGDIVNIDVTAWRDGFHGDTNATFFVGEPAPHAAELVEVTHEALAAAIRVCGPGVPFSEVGRTIHAIADAAGMSVVREYVGHGIGALFHAAPAVLHHRNRRAGVMELRQTFTIEPILTLGGRTTRLGPDGWSVLTADGSLTAQFEHTLAITEDGAEVLTLVQDAAQAG